MAGHSNNKISLSRARGFTIVELLIVIVVIAILAAIVIMAYTGVQNKAHAAAAQSASHSVATMLASNYVTNGTYPADLSTINNGNPLPTTDGSTYTYHPGAGNASYCVTVTNGNSSYKVTDTATQPTAGGCPGDGVNGAAAITNYAADPDATAVGNFGQSGASPAPSTASIATDQVHHGTTALKRTITGTGASGTSAAVKIPTHELKILAGTTMSWSFWVYSTRAGTISPYSDGSKVSDGTYAGCGSATVNVPANTWQKVTASCTPAIDMYPTQVGGYNLAVQAGDYVWFDEYMVAAGGSLPNYADGNTASWVWSGTPNGSSSTGPAQ